jgi:hypothetical protein
MASKGQASAGDSAVAPIGWNYPVRAALGGRVLSREWLRSWLAEGAAAVREFARVGRYPLVQRVYAREVFDRLMLLWARGQELLDALDRLPQVLGHDDAFLRNLFLRSERLLAVDWAFLGPGPVGAELAPLVTASVAFRGVARDRWSDLEQTAVEACLCGLQDAGLWRTTSAPLRLRSLLSAPLRPRLRSARLASATR